MTVYKLTAQQAEELEGVILDSGAIINLSVKDKHGNIIISQQQFDSIQIGEPIDYEPIKQEEDEI